MAKRAAARQFAKAFLNAGTDAGLSGQTAEATVKAGFLVPEKATINLVWHLPGGLALYKCLTGSLIALLGSLWQNAEFNAAHRRRPVHFSSEPYESRVTGMDVELLHKAYACLRSVTIETSKSTH